MCLTGLILVEKKKKRKERKDQKTHTAIQKPHRREKRYSNKGSCTNIILVLDKQHYIHHYICNLCVLVVQLCLTL